MDFLLVGAKIKNFWEKIFYCQRKKILEKKNLNFDCHVMKIAIKSAKNAKIAE